MVQLNLIWKTTIVSSHVWTLKFLKLIISYRQRYIENRRIETAHCMPHVWLLKQGLPYSQFLRIRHIWSNRTDFDIESRKCNDQFLARGYKSQWLELALEKVNILDDVSIKYSKIKKNLLMLCCTTYTYVKNIITVM